VPPGPDDLGQVLAGLQRRGVDRGAAVAQQQGARVAVGAGLRRALLQVGDRAVRAEPDVAVRVDESGDDPAVGDQVLRSGQRLLG
jgi:hypothetical protein